MTLFIPDDPSVTCPVRFLPRAPAFDTDAAVAIAAVEATGATLSGVQKNAANDFIVAIKNAMIWDKIDLLYLFIGGTAAAHSVNWKSPGTYNVVWYNSPTHDSTGVQFGGISYGATGYVGSNAEQLGLFAYVNGMNTVDTYFPMLAAQHDGFALDAVLLFGSDNLLATMIGAQSSRPVEAFPARSLGFIFGGRSSSTQIDQRVSGTTYSYPTAESGTSCPPNSMNIGAYNYEGSPALFTDGRIAAAGAAFSALDAFEIETLEAAINTLQTALSRS